MKKWRLQTLKFDRIYKREQAQSERLGQGVRNNREFKQSTTAGATTAAVTEKVWGEYVSVVC